MIRFHYLLCRFIVILSGVTGNRVEREPIACPPVVSHTLKHQQDAARTDWRIGSRARSSAPS